MKRFFIRRILLAGAILFTVPAALWAQNKKEEKMNFEVKEFKKFFSLVFKRKTLKK